MSSYGKLTTSLVGAWFALAFAASALGWFRNDSARIGAGVGLAALTPILVFTLWSATSPKFRKFTATLDPRLLTLAQTWRIVGFVFVLLEAKGRLPGIFAWPAGYGDMFIGLTATFAAWKLASSSNRNAFITWQVLGIIDLVMAVTLGTTARMLSPQAATMAPMTVLPLSLVPTFLVPLFLMFHMICIAQARAWRSSSGNIPSVVAPVQHLAV